MRKVIASLQVSLDGFIEGPNGELDWAMMEDDELWKDIWEEIHLADTFVLGRGMYPGYEKYWHDVLAGKHGSKNEIAYARHAEKTPHILISRTVDKVAWKTTRIVRDAQEIRKMRRQPGKNMLVLGGATLVSSLMNLGLIDELRLMVNPLVLGGGKALFRDVRERQSLKLMGSKLFGSGKVGLAYGTETPRIQTVWVG